MTGYRLHITARRAHDEFRGMGLSGVTGFLGVGGVVVDVRGVFDAGEVKKQRLHYETL
ncbi:MAG: hypothetical protein U9N61_09475 [Euryarchaeota archaeon]|nr:hypothetical protein [Euryarchaeota archaeon]MEA1999530.1 hypothetical protein [Euryarchaeota archaeon]